MAKMNACVCLAIVVIVSAYSVSAVSVKYQSCMGKYMTCGCTTYTLNQQTLSTLLFPRIHLKKIVRPIRWHFRNAGWKPRPNYNARADGHQTEEYVA